MQTYNTVGELPDGAVIEYKGIRFHKCNGDLMLEVFSSFPIPVSKFNWSGPNPAAEWTGFKILYLPPNEMTIQQVMDFFKNESKLAAERYKKDKKKFKSK